MFSTYLLCWSSHHHLFPKQHRLQGAKRLSHVCCQAFHSSRYIWKHKVWSRTSACDSVSLTHSMMGVIDTAAVHEHMLKTVEQNHGPEVLRLYSLLLWLDHLLSLKFWLLSMLWPDILYLDPPTCRSDATITFYMEPMAGVPLRAGVSHHTLPHDCFQKKGVNRDIYNRMPNWNYLMLPDSSHGQMSSWMGLQERDTSVTPQVW